MAIVAPSMLSCDFAHMARDVEEVVSGGAEWLHLDVMDGVFVPNISFGAPVIKKIRRCTDAVFDTHLMIVDPSRYIKDFADAGSNVITIHYESCDDPAAVLRQIRSYGIRAGISVKPATPVSVLEPIADDIDLILIMSVEPGFGGQKFMPCALPKLEAARALANAASHHIDIEVDGGITVDNAQAVKDAGANVIVAGSSVFGAADRAAAIHAIGR